jgi:hypothetical protein
MHELGSFGVMRLDQPLGQSRHVACALSCISMRISLEEGIKLHRFAGILPEQFSTEARRHREAVVAADQRMVIRCFGDNLARLRPRCFSCAILGGSRAEALIWIMPFWRILEMAIIQQHHRLIKGDHNGLPAPIERRTDTPVQEASALRAGHPDRL